MVCDNDVQTVENQGDFTILHTFRDLFFDRRIQGGLVIAVRELSAPRSLIRPRVLVGADKTFGFSAGDFGLPIGEQVVRTFDMHGHGRLQLGVGRELGKGIGHVFEILHNRRCPVHRIADDVHAHMERCRLFVRGVQVDRGQALVRSNFDLVPACDAVRVDRSVASGVRGAAVRVGEAVLVDRSVAGVGVVDRIARTARGQNGQGSENEDHGKERGLHGVSPHRSRPFPGREPLVVEGPLWANPLPV